ncbi:MAG: Ig-like domain-containing protein, partial [Bythopirellula sp.]
NWWYSTDGGQTWDGLGTVSTSSARVLAANSLTRIYFEPNDGYSGASANGLTFHAWDRSDDTVNGTAGVNVSGGGGSSAFSVASDIASVSVLAVNDAPTINTVPDQATSEDIVLGPIALTVGDVDTPVENLIVTAISSDQTIVPNGNISISGSGENRSLTITPALNQHGGPVAITVTVSDGALEAVEQFDVVVNSQPDAPVGNDDFFVVNQDETLNVPGPGPLSNDADGDGDPLTLVVVSGPANGTLLPQSDGSFLYIPAPGFVGDDAFRYVAHDGLAASNIATVRISVQPELAPLPPEAEAPPDELLPRDPAAEDLPAGNRPRRVTDRPAINDPTPEAPGRQRIRSTTIDQLSPAGDPGSESAVVASDSPVVPRQSMKESPPSAAGDDLPNQPASQLGTAEGEHLQSRREAVALQDDLDELNARVEQAAAIERLADNVAFGLSATLAAGYALSLGRNG